VNLILDNMLADGKIKLFIVVMPFGYAAPPGSEPDFDRISDHFSHDLIEDVIPFVQSHYRVYTDRGRRAIAGMSMGGVESLDIGISD
jgi:endo-1,4-beta-xylanase